MTQSKECKASYQPIQTQNSYKRKPTLWESLFMGSVAGGAEVIVDHPLWVVKTRLQQNQPLSLDPRVLYRGIFPNAASMIPITAMQVGLNRLAQSVFYNNSNDLSNVQRIGSAFFAGVGSAFASCPTERVMTHQGKAGDSFYRSARYFMNVGGVTSLYSGLAATMLREGMFTAFFLAVTPMLKTEIKSYVANDYFASLIAGMTAGVGATIASHGVDTIKTIQQSADVAQPVGFVEATKKIYSNHGFKGFFKGAVPRGARVMSAVTIMGWVNEKLEAEFARNKSESDDHSSREMKC